MTNFLFKKLLWFFKKLIPCGISLSNRHLLMLNGHGSHVILEVIEQTQKFGLNMIILPLHVSHVFQPWNVAYFDTTPNSSMDSTVNPNRENNKRIMSSAHSSVHSTLGVEGCVGAPGWRLGRVTSKSITHMDLHQKKKKNKLVNAWLEHFLCINKYKLTRLNTAWIWGKPPPFPSCSIICAWPPS
jgi:hypothetical protein